MATQFVKVSSEFQVNLAPQQDNSQTDPDIAVVPDGRFLTVFEDEFVNGPTADNNIIGQFFNRDGSFSGGNFGIETDAGVQRDAAVAPRTTGSGAGGAVVVWEDTTSAAGDIQLAIISSTGVNLTSGAELNVVTGTTGVAKRQRSADVATLADGRSLIAWQQDYSNFPPDIFARILDPAGIGFTTSDRISVAEDSFFSQSAPAVAASGNTALIVFQEVARGNSDIDSRLFTGTGLGFSYGIANHTDPLFDPDVATLGDKRFVIVYRDDADVFGRIFEIFDPSTPPQNPRRDIPQRRISDTRAGRTRPDSQGCWHGRRRLYRDLEHRRCRRYSRTAVRCAWLALRQ
jgi:hypothetical protein